MSRREEILAQVQSVQAMPASTSEVLRLFQAPDVDTAKLTRAIELDPGLAANILRLANSPYFGTPRSTSSIKDAIVRLGTKNIYQLVMSSAVAPLIRESVRGYELPPGEMLRHSIAVGVGAERLGEALDCSRENHTFTAGLLHDIGKVVLGSFLEVDAAPIVTLATEKHMSFEKAEREVLGVDHAELGAFLLEQWSFPAPLVEVVRWHHQPGEAQDASDVVHLVHVSDALCMMGGIGTGIDGLQYRPSPETRTRLKLSRRIGEKVFSQIMTGLEELEGMFADPQ